MCAGWLGLLDRAEAHPARCVAGAAGGGLGWGRAAGERLAVRYHDDTASQSLLHFDTGVGVSAACGARQEWQGLTGKAHGVVACDGRKVREAEDAFHAERSGNRMIGGAGQGGKNAFEFQRWGRWMPSCPRGHRGTMMRGVRRHGRLGRPCERR